MLTIEEKKQARESLMRHINECAFAGRPTSPLHAVMVRWLEMIDAHISNCSTAKPVAWVEPAVIDILHPAEGHGALECPLSTERTDVRTMPLYAYPVKNADVTVGVGSGDGILFVHGSHEAINRVQAAIFDAEKWRRHEASTVEPSEKPSINIADRVSGLQFHPKWKLMPESPDDDMLHDAQVAMRAANFHVNGEQPRDPVVQERILLQAAYTAMFNRAPKVSDVPEFEEEA